MNNTFENETKKKLLSASLLEHLIRTLVWISVYLYMLKTLYLFSYTVYLSCLIIKVVWRNISLFVLQNKIHSSTHHTLICAKF